MILNRGLFSVSLAWLAVLAAASAHAQNDPAARPARPAPGFEQPVGSQQPTDGPALAFSVAKVVTMDPALTVINDAVVLVNGGRIERVGPAADVPIPDGYERHEMSECWLVPGLVEAHNHTAGRGSDLNDMVYQANPGLDTRTAIDPDSTLTQMARTGGVTSTMFIPGSGTNVSGFGTLAKTGGRTPDEAIVRSPGSLKIAQTGNPEWYFGGNWTRFMNWNTRTTLEKAAAYDKAWNRFEAGEGPEPEFSPYFEGFRGLFRGEFPATVHTQQYQVFMSTIRLLRMKFDIWTVFDHCTFDAWKLGPLIRDDPKAFVMAGPRVFHPDYTSRRMTGVVNGWWKNGIRRLGVNTDAPVIPQQQLSYQAAMGCWYGFQPYPALRAVTQQPAQALGIYNRTGSIEPGKDADFGVWTGDPIDPRSACLITVVNGRIEYNAAQQPYRRF